ncbi:GNAT family N-acetyltransferase [Devosia sp.]|uniref:GNAT family N-acetyltransferase n=1 Tax=Devosia sp. TaxID=1871048 RepID=UPI0035B4A935
MDVTLTTSRLVLRQPRLIDAERLARFLDNFAVSGNLARVPYPYRLADAKAWLRSWRPDRPAGETGFTIELPGEGLIGHVGFHADVDGIVIGYWLAQPFWNRGFMTEAARGALEWYFETSDAEMVQSGVFHFNKASLAIQRKLGFIEIGTSSRLCLARGEELRHIDTRLTRAAWAAKRAASGQQDPVNR